MIYFFSKENTLASHAFHLGFHNCGAKSALILIPTELVLKSVAVNASVKIYPNFKETIS